MVVKKAEGDCWTVTASDRLGELVPFMYGRQAHTKVDLDGPPDAVEAVCTASFGI